MQQIAKQKAHTVRDWVKFILIDQQPSLKPIWSTCQSRKQAWWWLKQNKQGCPTVLCCYHSSIVFCCLLFRRLSNKTVSYCLLLSVILVLSDKNVVRRAVAAFICHYIWAFLCWTIPVNEKKINKNKTNKKPHKQTTTKKHLETKYLLSRFAKCKNKWMFR